MSSLRIASLRKLLEGEGVDAAVLTAPAPLRYFCGFTGTDGVLVVTAERSVFLTDSRYSAQAAEQVTADEVEEYRLKLEGIADWIRARPIRSAAFDAGNLSYGSARRLMELTGDRVTWKPWEKELAALRGVKDAAEIAALEAAAGLNAAALEEVLPLIRPGVPENQIALELELALRRLGGEEKAFDFIVASGLRGALPHGVASGRPLQAGELVTIDFGTRVDGYHSDETVTLALGEVGPQLREIFDTVYHAQRQALAAVRPGASLREIDDAARGPIGEAGYGERFGHGLGHGVGLEVHEFPTVNSRAEETAEEGMVFTVEPGIYVPGLGGVRIEDTIVVTADGCRRLTRIPKEFRTLPA